MGIESPEADFVTDAKAVMVRAPLAWPFGQVPGSSLRVIGRRSS
jgi:hypothetical protein